MTNLILSGVLYSVFIVKIAAFYGKVFADYIIQEIYDLGIRFQDALNQHCRTDR